MSKVSEYPEATDFKTGDLLDLTSKTSSDPNVYESQKLDFDLARKKLLGKINEYEGLITVKSSTLTELRLKNDYEGISVTYGSGYVIISCTAGFPEKTSVKVTFGYEVGSDTALITTGGYRWTDGVVYVWVSVNNSLDVNNWLEKATVNISSFE